MLIKKGAMFGLDARIALAIFGALSVISGAALYSAIQESRVTALITDMNELGKAWEQYYLDTGTYIIESSGSHVRSAYLSENTNNVAGWQGPYIARYIVSGPYLYGKNDASLLRLFLYRTQDYSGVCTATDCHLWVRFDEYDSNMDLIKALDERVDGTAGASTGKLHYFPDSPDTNQQIVLYRYAPFKK